MQDRRGNRQEPDDVEYPLEEHPDDPPLRQQVAILWRERQWARYKRAERVAQLKIYGAWASGGAALAAILSTIVGNWPTKK